ncbi:MAG: sugar ABC transporter ATP-binding protein [Spirochaetota bacterium]
MENIIELEHIDKRFGGVHALKDISLVFREGTVYCLAGENGCGKTTLIKTISGVHSPDSGAIRLNGEKHKKLSPIQSIAAGIQVIYQDFSLFHNLSVAENIAVNQLVKVRKKYVVKSIYQQIARKALAKIGVELDLDKIVGDLSVADKQLVAIARALTSEQSRLIIMDEPTSALTHTEIKRLLDIILLLKSQRIAVLFISHKLKELMDVCDQLIVMRNGQLVEQGPASEFTEKRIATLMTGREMNISQGEKIGGDQERLFEAQNICVQHSLTNISFTLARGEVLGLTGLMGCGRTELLSVLFGLLPLSSGTLYLRGESVAIKSPITAKRYGIGYVPEDRLTEGLFLRQSIQNNSIVAALKSFASKLGIISFVRVKEIVKEKIEELKLNTLNIDTAVQELSGGNQQRVVIAKWLCVDSHILLLNGPSVGVDIGSKFEIHRKIQELRQTGTSFILASDDVPELVANCDKVLLLHKGKVHKEFHGESLCEDILVDELDKLR